MSDKKFKDDAERLDFYLKVQQGLEDDPEGQETNWNKLCDVQFGDQVEIVWTGEMAGTVDFGYVLGWPTHSDSDANLVGIVHVPKPQNPGGIGDVEPEWMTLHELSINPLVRCVRERGSFK